MDIQALKDAVIEETGRPDKAAMIERAVKAIVLIAHNYDSYPQDRVSAIVVPGVAGKIVTEALPTRWRVFEIIAPLAADGTTLKKKFKRRSPDNTMAFEGTNLTEHFHVAGQTVVMESLDEIVNIGWSFFQDPDISTLAKTTWITLKYGQELIDGANAYVYKKLGDEKTAKDYRDLWLGNPRLRIEGHLDKITRENLIEDI